MYIFQIYLTGLLVAHLLWFFFFTSGQLLRPRVPDESDARSMAHLVITTVAGMALAGFGLLILGFIHLLNGFGIAGALLVEGILFWWLKDDNWLSWTFWRGIFERFVEPWRASTLFIYLLFLALGVRAVLPPTFADSVTYHLAYAVDWANAGRIYVDPFLRFPYYANNFLLLYSALFVLKLGGYCHFLTWLCGLLTCFGVQAFFTPAKPSVREQIGWKEFHPQEFLIPLGVALSPVFLRYLNVGYIDLPIGLFLLIPVLCAYEISRRQRFERELVVTAAFCAGMKPTLIVYLPFFVASLFFAAAPRQQWRKITLLSLALVALSLPWYLRNLIEAHDPVPPLFNFIFKHPDPIFNQTDAAIFTRDIIAERNPAHFLLLPFRFFSDPESKDFRESGVSAMILLLPAPILFLLAQLSWRRRLQRSKHLIYLSVAVIFLASPWFVSPAGRFSLHWYPALAAWVGVMISQIQARAEALPNPGMARSTIGIVVAVISCILIAPSPTEGCMRFYRGYYAQSVPLFGARRELQVYLNKNLNGYRASQAVIATLAFNRQKSGRVLALREETLAFYFRQAKITSVGDHYGPARYRDLIARVEQGNCLPYLDQFDIVAVIADPRTLKRWHLFYETFRSQLKKNHFTEYRAGTDPIPIFFRDDIKPMPDVLIERSVGDNLHVDDRVDTIHRFPRAIGQLTY